MVRLTPLIVIEPFTAMYPANACGARTTSFQLSPRSVNSTTSPTPSTWPLTRCPPSLSARRNAFSRFTGAPIASSPSVQFSVSLDTSTVKLSPLCATTVRHTPFTAMLSPSCTSPRSSALVAITRRNPPSRSLASAMCPASAMIPLNIFHLYNNAQIVPDLPHILPLQIDALIQTGQFAQLRHAARLVAQQLRRDIHQQFIHQPRAQHCAVQGAARFQQHFVATALREIAQHGRQIDLPVTIRQHTYCYACFFKCRDLFRIVHGGIDQHLTLSPSRLRPPRCALPACGRGELVKDARGQRHAQLAIQHLSLIHISEPTRLGM